MADGGPTFCSTEPNGGERLDAACQAMRQVMRETVKRHSLWYLIEAAAHNVINALLYRG